MPRGEKIPISEWKKISSRQHQNYPGLALHPHSTPTRSRDTITDRALAALDVGSSDESDIPPMASVEFRNDNNSLNSLNEASECSMSELKPAAEQDNPTDPTGDETEQQMEVKREAERNEGNEQPVAQESPEIIDLTLDSDEEDEKPAPVASTKNGAAATTLQNNSGNIKSTNTDNNSARLLVSQQDSCTGMMVLEEFREVKTVPASHRLPFLSGKLTVSKNIQSCLLVFRGVWGYEKRPDYTPQRFELIADVALQDLGSRELPSTCAFNGAFVYHNNPIEEKNVILSFHAPENQMNGFNVKGYGMNQLGRFKLKGTAERINKSDEISYSLMMNKTYTEFFPPADDGKPKAKKRKSEVDSDSNSNTKRHLKSSQVTESDTSSQMEKQESRVAHTSTESPPLLTNGRTSGNWNEHEQIQDKAGKTRPTVFDQIHHARKDTMQQPAKSPFSQRMLGIAAQKQPISAAKINETLNNDTIRRQINKPWSEFGSLSNATPTKSPVKSDSKRHMSWTVKDISRPSFPKNTLDFCETLSMQFVNDLIKTDSRELCAHLMSFNGFKAACAFCAWKTKQRFHDVYRLSLAKYSIKKWKLVAKSWWRKTIGSDWSCKEGRLSSFLSTHECLFLEINFGIISADQLLMSNHGGIIDTLRNTFGPNNALCEGMFYSWIMRSQEKSNTAFGHQRNAAVESLKLSLHSALSAGATVHETTHQCPSPQNNGLMTNGVRAQAQPTPKSIPLDEEFVVTIPMSCLDFLFIRSQRITSDEQLAKINVAEFAPRYISFLKTNNHKVTFPEASRIVSQWKSCAQKGKGNDDDRTEATMPIPTRIDKSPENCKVMFTVSNLSTFTTNNGSPTKTIYTFDDANDVLYAFRVHIEKSKVAPDSGNGAFLTFEGAKILKQSSYWKKKKRSDIPYLPQTRKELTAVFSGGKGSAAVTLKGKNIHGDEWFYGPNDGIGIFNEYTLNDFIDVENLTYSSKHVGCAMIELDRYAPLLPEDRKRDLIFGFKDFVFSHEPSSWRFDVEEDLNGHKQCVDFTDDTTGSPHTVARSHVAMYVNEVGHNQSLVENVWPLGDGRSVSYYVFIDRPMIKGETVELLVNYGEGYEDMRIRRGYGKTNSLGVASDENRFARTGRNLHERRGIEDSILSCSEEDLKQAIDFFSTRVWDGLVASASNEGENGIYTLQRQHIARRRLNWLASKFRTRLLQLSADDCQDTSHGGKEEFYEGMFVYVNGWMPADDPRPPYTGIATIDSIHTAGKYNRKVFNVSIPSSQKTIHSVPEGVVTLPVEEDLAGMSSTVLRTWKKHNQEKRRIQIRDEMLSKLETAVLWDASYINQALPDGMYEIFLEDYCWEVSEELLHLMTKHQRITDPFDNEKWCPMSQTLLKNMLFAIADYMLPGRKTDTQALANALVSLALKAAQCVKDTPKSDSKEAIHDLSLHSKDSTPIIIVQSIRSQVSVQDFLDGAQQLDLEWYICNQIVMAVHPLLSSIDWQESNWYSLRMLCEKVGLDYSSPYLTFAHTTEVFTPLVRLC